MVARTGLDFTACGSKIPQCGNRALQGVFDANKCFWGRGNQQVASPVHFRPGQRQQFRARRGAQLVCSAGKSLRHNALADRQRTGVISARLDLGGQLLNFVGAIRTV